MNLANFWQAIQGNLISVGIGLAIFVMAYLSNMCFSTYYNVRILGEQFEPSKLKMSGLKIVTFGVGTALLTMAITLILPWANQNGLNIPDEYTEVITTVAILGVCLIGSLKYIAEAFIKMGKILNAGTNNDNTPTVISNEEEVIAAFSDEIIEADLSEQSAAIS